MENFVWAISVCKLLLLNGYILFGGFWPVKC